MHKVFVLFFCFSATVSFSQKKDKELERANAKYEELSFVKAGKLYERLVEKGYKSKEIYARLGDTYFFNADYQNALKWYSKLFEDSEYNSPEYFYRYTVCLRSTDNYQEAFSVISSYYKKIGREEEAKKWDPIIYLQAMAQQSNRYGDVFESGVNSAFSDFGVAFVPNEEAIHQAAEIARLEKIEKARAIKENEDKRRKENNKILGTKEELSGKAPGIVEEDIEVNREKLPRYKEVIYATAKDTGVVVKRKNSWSDTPFLKLYSAEIDETGKLKNEKILPGEINTKYDQSTPVITKDGLTMYFTRLVPYDKVKNKAKNKNAISHLKIYQAQKVNNKWVDIQELPYPINIDGTSSAHPALSANDDQLFFVSNRKKKMYDTDLYVINRKKNGGFDRKAESLGENINTYGRETFPFVDDNGVLYFSSDGHPGLGGLDVFAAVKGSDDKYVIVNMGEPVNSTSDDFAYVIDNESKKGFFSSDRKGGTGSDDLYRFLEVKPVVFPFKLSPDYFGTVKDSVSGEPLDNVEITIYNDRDEVVKTFVTDATGKYLFDLPALKNHTFVFKKKGYTVAKLFVDGLKIGQRKDLSVALFNELQVVVDDKVITLKEGDDLTHKLKLDPIYFDYGGYTIRKSSKVELDKVINLLKNRPSLSVEIRSHTDSRGKSDYNMKLSKNRAKTTIDYIVLEGGISRDRVWGDGYGESQLINKCADNVKCTEAEHALNRRSEFILIIKE